MKQDLKIATVIGIPIEVNYSWIIIFGLVSSTLAKVSFPMAVPGLSDALYWIAGVLSAIILFLSLLLHELAHSYIAVHNNISIKKISLFIFGGVAHMEKEPDDPLTEFKVAIAGPIMSLIIVLVFILLRNILAISHAHHLTIAMLNYVILMNAGIVIFNMIPGFPLDGGRVFRAMVWKISNNLRHATMIASNIGKAFAYLIMLAGIICLLFTQVVPGIWFRGIWFLVIGLFLHEASDLSYQHLIIKKALVGVPVTDVMEKDIITVRSDIDLDDLVNNYFYKHRHMGFPVVDKGILKGLVMLQNVKAIPQDQWKTTTVDKVLTTPRADLLAAPDTDCLEALLQVTKTGLGRILVVDNGKLLGIVVQRDLVKLFEIKSHLCR